MVKHFACVNYNNNIKVLGVGGWGLLIAPEGRAPGFRSCLASYQLYDFGKFRDFEVPIFLTYEIQIISTPESICKELAQHVLIRIINISAIRMC